jgi:hypothetical protein
MKVFADNSKRLRRRRGVSQSGLRRIESIARQGERAVRRSFIAVQRPVASPDHHSITISEGRTYARQ